MRTWNKERKKIESEESSPERKNCISKKGFPLPSPPVYLHARINSPPPPCSDVTPERINLIPHM